MLWAFDQEVFPASNKFVLVALANFCGDTGKSYPGVNSICKITSLQDETVRKALGALVMQQVITDTGLTAGETGRVKVYQLPEAACETPRKTGVLKRRGNTPVIHCQSTGNTPENRNGHIQGTGTATETVGCAGAPVIESEHARFARLWTEGYLAKFGVPYKFNGGRDGKAIKELLTGDATADLLMELVTAAWKVSRAKDRDTFWCDKLTTIHALNTHWNEIQVEVSAAAPKVKATNYNF